MRSAVLISALLLAVSCSDNKKVVKRIEGTWRLEEILLNDGQRIYPNETYVFAKGEKGGKTYAAWTKYTADYADTISGKYLVTKKGDYVILRNESVVPAQTDTCTIDDMDSDMLIIRSNLGVHFLYKNE